MSERDDWGPLIRRRVSRRVVLKSAGRASVGAAGLALVGCGGDDDEQVEALRSELAKAEADLEQARAGLTAEPQPRTEAQTPAAGRSLARYPRRRIAALADLAEGQPLRFEYPLQGQASILIKLGAAAAGGVGPEGDVVAFSELCTHMGCPVGSLYNPEHRVLGPCACHFTTFDLTHRGMVVIGQATENLPQVVLELDGDDIYAVGMLGIVYGFRDNLADASVV